MRRAAIGGRDPATHLPWGVVPHVLRVPAFQIGDPVPFLIGVKADDPRRSPSACPWISLHSFLSVSVSLPAGRRPCAYGAGRNAPTGAAHC